MEQLLTQLQGKDYREVKALDFEDLVVEILKDAGSIKRQVVVQDRGDGRRGRIDLVLTTKKEVIGIEIDYGAARKKSIFKLNQLSCDRRVILLRAPFSIIEL
mgnify:CR=1 FL=1